MRMHCIQTRLNMKKQKLNMKKQKSNMRKQKSSIKKQKSNIKKQKTTLKIRKKNDSRKSITKRNEKAVKTKSGSGLLNSIINKLPFEMHLPGYRYCGPGTKLEKRLKRGDMGINQLDEACKSHDIAYTSNDINVRRSADQELASKAWERVKNGGFGEKAAALTVAGLMKLKSGVEKVGGGLTYEQVLGSAIQEASSSLKKASHINEKEATEIAVRAARRAVKRNRKRPGSGCKYRVISIPKTGGALPILIPLFAGLSAVGSLAGGAAAVVNAVKSTKNARSQLKENKHHNQIIEAIAIGNKKGSGLHLKPYRKGLGLYLNPQTKTKNH